MTRQPSLHLAALLCSCLSLACGTTSGGDEHPPAQGPGASVPEVAPEVAAEIAPPVAAEPPAEGEPTDLALHDGALYAVDESILRRGDVEASAPGSAASRAIVDVSGRFRIARLAVGDAGIAFIGQVVESGQSMRRGAIMIAAHDGTGLREIWSGPGDQYELGLFGDEVVWTSMALDPRLGALDESSGALMRAPVAGGPARVAARIDHPRQLVILGDDAFVGARGAVVRVPLRVPGPAQPFPVSHPIGALAVDATDIVLSDLTTSEILTVPRAGGGERSIVPRAICVRDLALDGASVYFACGDLYRVARGGGPVAQLTPRTPNPSLNAVALGASLAWGYSALEDRFVSAPR